MKFVLRGFAFCSGRTFFFFYSLAFFFFFAFNFAGFFFFFFFIFFDIIKMTLAAFFFLAPTTAEEVQLSKGAKVLFYLQLLKNVFTLIGRSLSFPSIRFTSSFSPEKKKKRVSSFSISLFFFLSQLQY